MPVRKVAKTAEIESLKRQLAETSKQLKEIAVSVISNRGNDSSNNI